MSQMGTAVMEPKVMIAVPTAELSRQAKFYDHFLILDRPPNTLVTFAHGQSPARNRNVMIQQAIETNCTHIFFVDDDVILRPDTLTNLLKWDTDLVSGLYLMRNYPHQPIIFDVVNDDGKCHHYYLNGNGKKEGLVEIVASGLGCLLINMRVFEKLEKPYIRLGELETDSWCDDLGFFKRARQAGFTAYCDLEVKVGHISTVIIWPSHTAEGWGASYEATRQVLANE